MASNKFHRTSILNVGGVNESLSTKMVDDVGGGKIQQDGPQKFQPLEATRQQPASSSTTGSQAAYVASTAANAGPALQHPPISLSHVV